MSPLEQLPQEIFDMIVSNLKYLNDVCNFVKATQRAPSRKYLADSFVLDNVNDSYTMLYDAHFVHANVEFVQRIINRCAVCKIFNCLCAKPKLLHRFGCYECKGAGCENCSIECKHFCYKRVFKLNNDCMLEIRLNLKLLNNNDALIVYADDLITKISQYLFKFQYQTNCAYHILLCLYYYTLK
ncbi:ORF-98 [Catopsilia pomona nucleopolyhedrovirus]|uniref:ORF-98 n=1 Tax=Catopsilia pomona nucleopolyhedrovirus TaxID=1850906 RepID=A0A172WZG9_9ABAC|nr:ORF-98 [Catopsilia pomona nucleopolyhedrovirus]ANF29746.1 ORF-98 [Catopsilia pomona nucleopolyhedrovirus]